MKKIFKMISIGALALFCGTAMAWGHGGHGGGGGHYGGGYGGGWHGSGAYPYSYGPSWAPGHGYGGGGYYNHRGDLYNLLRMAPYFIPPQVYITPQPQVIIQQQPPVEYYQQQQQPQPQNCRQYPPGYDRDMVYHPNGYSVCENR